LRYFFVSERIPNTRIYFSFNAHNIACEKESIDILVQWDPFYVPHQCFPSKSQSIKERLLTQKFSGPSTCGIHPYLEIPVTTSFALRGEFTDRGWSPLSPGTRGENAVTEVHGYIWLDENALAANRRRGGNHRPGGGDVHTVWGGARVAKSRAYINARRTVRLHRVSTVAGRYIIIPIKILRQTRFYQLPSLHQRQGTHLYPFFLFSGNLGILKKRPASVIGSFCRI